MFFFYLNANPLCYGGLRSLCLLFNSIWLLFLTKCSCLGDLKHVWPHFPQNETGFRWERKGLATAEAQMEFLKVRRRCHNVSDSLIFQSSSLSRTGSSQFLYEMLPLCCFRAGLAPQPARFAGILLFLSRFAP